MVMRSSAMGKNLLRSIWRSLGRYIAIVAIIALGSSMFVGLLMTKADMVATGQRFMDQQNMFDLRLMSSYGWDQEDLESIADLEGVEAAEGLLYRDLMATVDGSSAEAVFRFYALPENLNMPALKGGRMPQSGNECLADGYHTDDSILGTVISLSASNEADALDSLKYDTYTVVGYVSSPLYMDMNRGTTSVGNGSLQNYYYIPADSFDMEYYPEIHITIPGEYAVYSAGYNQVLEDFAEYLEPLVKPLAQQRMLEFKAEAEKKYQEGLEEYQKGLAEFEQGKLDAEKELQEAEQKLQDGEQQYYYSQLQLQSGQAQLAEGKAELADGEAQLASGVKTLQDSKQQAYAQIDSGIQVLDTSRKLALAQQQVSQEKMDSIQAQIDALNTEIADAEAKLTELNLQMAAIDAQNNSLDMTIQSLQAVISAADRFPQITAEMVMQMQSQIADAQAQKEANLARRRELELEAQPLQEQLADPFSKRQALQEQLNDAASEKAVADSSLVAIDASMDALHASRAELDSQFAAAEAELLAGEQQLEEAREQIRAAEVQLASGFAALQSGREELDAGWADLEEGKETADQELREAEAELMDAGSQLEEAKEIIDSMTEATVFILDRSSNIGYNSLDSASDIVQGVSRVFPAFFLLVAALVCITTMTRMVEEERTQIGTLKALGYSNGAIICKYMVYAGSGAVVGCGLGVTLGSIAFPKILWEAYKIMLHITDDIVIRFNWGLIGAVVGAYTAVMLFVTRYCCRRALREAPAELIRPKAPDPGKKILFEYLPFWRRISFLNKVTIRNIFRYRQRLAMMLVGIGGCTALLLTGYGLRDSIVNVVDYQFSEVTTYDMTVYFTDSQSGEEQQDFLKDVAPFTEDAMFYHQSSVDLDFDNSTKEIYLIAAPAEVQTFIDLHKGQEPLEFPGTDEVLLTSGVAEAMGIRIGDPITLRNADMQLLELTVAGIYDNHVYNYAIIAPETMEKQWNAPVDWQMAFVTVPEDQDVHTAAAEITGMSDVMNISVSEDLAQMVGRMMDALDLVVWVIVVCAGALAVIVLYNLTNININERIREIATIKVLGFNAQETAAYIFKENLSLSAIGSILGLGLGYLLLLFVMSQIKIDMVWFKALAMPLSYVLAIALTMLSACLVDLIFYFKLDKINMAEALKSVE